MTEKGIKKVIEGKQEEGCRRRDGSVHDRGIAISELFPTTVHVQYNKGTLIPLQISFTLDTIESSLDIFAKSTKLHRLHLGDC
jgi:hypothetical protein